MTLPLLLVRAACFVAVAAVLLVPSFGRLGAFWRANVGSARYASCLLERHDEQRDVLWSAQSSMKGASLSACGGDLDPSHARYALWAARSALRDGDAHRALVLLSGFDGASEPSALRVRAEAIESLGDYAGAVDIWIQLGEASQLHRLARALRNSGQLDGAQSAYSAAWALDPQRMALPLAGFCWSYLEDRITAEAVLRKALNDYPLSSQRAGWSRRLATYLQRQGRTDDAEEVLELLLLEHPDDTMALAQLADLYHEGARVEDAVVLYQRAVALDPGYSDGYMAMGRLMVDEGRYTEAQVWFRGAQERIDGEGICDSLVDEANSWRSAGELARALARYRGAAARCPLQAGVYYHMSWALYLDNQLDEGYQAILTAIDLLHQAPASYYVRAGRIREAMGSTGDSIAMYTEALRIDPDNQTAQEALRRLQDES